MNKTVAICILICSIASAVVLTACAPEALSDKNSFLLGFVNHEYISFMGVLVTITLASAANIHIELNRYDEALGKSSFKATRGHLRDSAFALVAALCVAIATVVIKPLGPATIYWQSAFNSVALVTIIFSIMIVVDLTLAAFSMRPPGRTD